jgi:monovalent cation/hydrogen antiporter
METLEAILALGLYAMALAWVGRKLGVIDPIMLVLGGLVLAALPFAPELKLDPQTLLAIFLPPVLYQAALSLSWQELKSNLRPILLLAIGLVLFTAFSVAGLVSWLIPTIPFAAALVLGAIVSPPDAVAATAVLSKVRVPRRVVAILEGESLINDATALVLYAIAVAAVVNGTEIHVGSALLDFIRLGAGGLLFGLLMGWASVQIHRRLKDPLLEMMLSLALPFLIFTTSEHMHISGVIAVVAAGILRGAYSAKVVSAASRLQMLSMWNVIVFVLNAIGFLLIGLLISRSLEAFADHAMLALLAAIVCVTVIVVRFVWVWAFTVVPRQLFKSLRERDPMPPSGQVNVIAFAGMRGIVSLIAALALPTQIEPYGDFPGRDLILLLTYAVILVTLVGQGGLLGPLIRWFKVEAQPCTLAAARAARAKLRDAGLAAVRANIDNHSETAITRASQHYELSIARLRLAQENDAFEGLIAQDTEDYRSLSILALKAERQELARLRKAGEVDDEIARELQLEIDLHEILVGTERGAG